MGTTIRQEFGIESVQELVHGIGVVGVSRLCIFPAFSGPTVCTLIYFDDRAEIDVLDARHFRSAAFRGRITRSLREMRKFGPLVCWDQLRAAAFAAPGCSTLTCDGVGYRHSALDLHGGVEASWSNPSLSEHPQQCELAYAYEDLIQSTGILLQNGSIVRIRNGLMRGFMGRIDQLDYEKQELRVSAQLVGKEVSVSLGVSDIKCAPEAQQSMSSQ